jgi:hypothetical protein
MAAPQNKFDALRNGKLTFVPVTDERALVPKIGVKFSGQFSPEDNIHGTLGILLEETLKLADIKANVNAFIGDPYISANDDESLQAAIQGVERHFSKILSEFADFAGDASRAGKRLVFTAMEFREHLKQKKIDAARHEPIAASKLRNEQAGFVMVSDILVFSSVVKMGSPLQQKVFPEL